MYFHEKDMRKLPATVPENRSNARCSGGREYVCAEGWRMAAGGYIPVERERELHIPYTSG